MSSIWYTQLYFGNLGVDHTSNYYSVMYRIFSNLLYHSPAFPWHSRLFPTISVCPMTIPIRSVSLRCLWFVPLSVPSVFFHLFPSTSLFWLVSFQFSLLGSDRSESGSLLSIHLHSCSVTIPFPVDLCVYCPLILWPPFPLRIVFEGPVLGPAKDRDWTGPGPERTAKDQTT